MKKIKRYKIFILITKVLTLKSHKNWLAISLKTGVVVVIVVGFSWTPNQTRNNFLTQKRCFFKSSNIKPRDNRSKNRNISAPIGQFDYEIYLS